LITPASMAGDCVWPISRAQHPRHTGGVRYAVPSLAGGSAALYVCSVRKQWVEDFHYRALREKSGKTLIGVEKVCFNPGRLSGLAAYLGHGTSETHPVEQFLLPTLLDR